MYVAYLLFLLVRTIANFCDFVDLELSELNSSVLA